MIWKEGSVSFGIAANRRTSWFVGELIGSESRHHEIQASRRVENSSMEDKEKSSDVLKATEEQHSNHAGPQSPQADRPTILYYAYASLAVFILLINYFLAQFDKFVLSYFQDSFTASLHLTATEYSVLSGYATGIVYAILALPIAYTGDYFPKARVWVLTVSSLWWSLCVIFQGLSHNFWQVLLARIGMGIGQAAVAPLSISLISDIVPGWRNVFLGGSVFYVGVYIGEAISGQIATAFTGNDKGWSTSLRAIGITGLVVAVFLRIIIREPARRVNLVFSDPDDPRLGAKADPDFGDSEEARLTHTSRSNFARREFLETVSYIVRMRSFWLLVLSASFRQLSGNVFGFYMPSYLENTYPEKSQLLSRYGIIVGVVGTVAVLSGGLATSLLWNQTKLTPLYMTAIGGMTSSIFVLLMVFSRDIAGGDQDQGVRILYGTMSAAYLTAETWLGAMDALLSLLLPPRFKTFGLAIWSSIQVLIYSSGPEIIGLALRDEDPASPGYTKATQVALAVIIPVGYWIAGVGFLAAIPLLRKDLKNQLHPKPVPWNRKLGASSLLSLLVAFVIALFIAAIVYDAK